MMILGGEKPFLSPSSRSARFWSKARQGFEAGEDVFVIGDRFGRHARERSGGALRNAAHLAERQKVVERDDIAKRKGIVAVLKAVFAGLQQIEIKIVVKLLRGGNVARSTF